MTVPFGRVAGNNLKNRKNMFFPKEHPEINKFFQNIVKLNEKAASLLERRGENELLERLKDFSGSIFEKLSAMPFLDTVSIHEEILIKEIALVNSIFSRFKLEISRIVKVAKIVINSLKDFATDELKKIFTLMDELIDLIEFIWQKFQSKNFI